MTSTQTKHVQGYSEMASKMEALAKQQKGYLGIDSAKNDVGITVSYWKTGPEVGHCKIVYY
jgi:heme-degrading monooxygenase HmoA